MKAIVLVTLLLIPALLSAKPVRAGKVEAELVAGVRSVQPGETLTVALRLKALPTWHTYWINPGEAGLATRAKWTLPTGFKAGPLQFPVPHKFNSSGLIGYGYEDEVFLFSEITVPEKLTSKRVVLIANVSWLVCDPKQCLPGRAAVSLTLPVTSEAPKPSPWSAKLTEAQKKIPILLKEAQVSFKQKEDNFIFTVRLPKKWQGVPSSAQFYPEDNFCDLNTPAKFKDIAGGFEITVPVAEDFDLEEGKLAFVLDGLAQPLRFVIVIKH